MPVGYFNCPACGGVIAAEERPGTEVRCPLCGQRVVVQEGGEIPPPVAPVQMASMGAPPNKPLDHNLALDSILCGVAGIIGLSPVAILGLIMGLVALRRTRRQPARYDGRGLAIAGICTSILGILLAPLFINAVLSSLARARELDLRTVCMANMRGIGQAMSEYAARNQGAFPEAGADWQSRLLSAELIAPWQLKCPSDKSEATCSYIYIPGQAIGTANTMSLPMLYDRPDNHGKEGGNVLYTDGHVLFEKSPRFEEIIGENKPPDA
jgi:prepilin-type processing-associated H-X9-DG protein